MANNFKNIQLAFGYLLYQGTPNIRRGPRAYYDLRGTVRHWLHYNGLFTPLIITELGSWDALVGRIMADPNFPHPVAGAAPAFPRPSSPSSWNGAQCRYICNFIHELCKSWDKSVSYYEYMAQFDTLWQCGATRIMCYEYATYKAYHKARVQGIVTDLAPNLQPQRPNIPPANQLVARVAPPPSDRGPGVPIPLAPEMMDWALANVALIHRMPGFDDGINNNLSMIWNNQANIAFILPGGNPHYGLPPPALVQPLPPPLGPVVDALAITRAIQTVVASLEVLLQGYTDLLLNTEWKETLEVVGSFVVVDSTTVQKVNPTSELFP
ncbi:hypothetical protein L211DRAFT_854548 [Terfezia boudieri ATCC MYA-4762]|uniref:Uncharacterized protein n=1 Tax=Terfezia boudieri ATCC MYA-4762 TaxID=1051890 RepID=A0A3N4L576_9PEZI|nr:hypothetical protein L211DRAFT_854548 [Terfezia boudieri ATCC MYA-4762]